jgi:hypothetical protein
VNRQQTLAKAESCIMGDRQNTHGPPEDSFKVIASFWSAYLGIEIAPYQVAELMVLLKVARSKSSPHHDDHYVDQVGYSAIAAELAPANPKKDFDSIWNQPPPKMDEKGREMYERDLAQAKGQKVLPPNAHIKNNPGVAPLPATALHNSSCG